MMRAIDFDLFKWVVSGLLSLIAALLVVMVTLFRTDLQNVENKLDAAITRQQDYHTELIRGIATLTGRVDQLSEELRRR
jgi:hypothetical protein